MNISAGEINVPVPLGYKISNPAEEDRFQVVLLSPYLTAPLNHCFL